MGIDPVNGARKIQDKELTTEQSPHTATVTNTLAAVDSVFQSATELANTMKEREGSVHAKNEQGLDADLLTKEQASQGPLATASSLYSDHRKDIVNTATQFQSGTARIDGHLLQPYKRNPG